jgi:hypothetical protein
MTEPLDTKSAQVHLQTARKSWTNQIVDVIYMLLQCCRIPLSQRLSKLCSERLLHICQLVTDGISCQ